MGLGSLNRHALNTIPLNGVLGVIEPPSAPVTRFGLPLDAECTVYPLHAEWVFYVCELGNQDPMEVCAEDRIFFVPRVQMR